VRRRCSIALDRAEQRLGWSILEIHGHVLQQCEAPYGASREWHDRGQHEELRRRRRVGGEGGTDVELHDLTGRLRIGDLEVDARHAAAERLVGTGVRQHVATHRDVGEVDDHVGALGRSHDQPVACRRRQVGGRRQEPALIANLPGLRLREFSGRTEESRS
jgi:hypothetical protein